ncbi:MAG: transcription termination/antitermination protein NusG [Bacteroidota bacterium]
MAYNWYIVQAHSGFEKKVAQAISEKAERENLADSFEEISVPTESVVEMKNGRKVSTERKFFPGYVMVKMKMSDAAWHLVKTIPKVTGFLGGQGRPQPISDAEADRILRQVEEGIAKPKRQVAFEIGETVKINDGPFDSFVGTVEEVDEEKGTLKVSVSIFGRTTPVELEFQQVEKV